MIAPIAALVAVVAPCSFAAPTKVVTIDLPAGTTILRAPLAIPSDADEVHVDGHGAATLCGGLVIDAPQWQAPAADVSARLPEEARSHARMLVLPADALAAWGTGLVGPIHFGHGTTVAAAPTEIFVGDVALVPACWPNEGWATIERVVDGGSVPRNAAADIPAAERASEAPRGATFVPADRSRLARWADADTWMYGFWNWDWSDEQLPVAAIDATSGTVTLGMPHRYGVAQRGRFRVTNALGELDAPGECWLDRANGRVIAWLPEGGEHASVTVSMLAAPMITVPSGANAPRVRVSGVTFVAARGAAIVGRGVHGATIERCAFRNIGAGAVTLDGDACRVARCTFTDVGGTGVALAGGDRATLRPGDNRVEDCTFARCGRLQRTYHPAIALDGVGQHVLRNELADLPHIAITFAGNEHRIEGNHIHHVVRETGDAGAIYTGRDWTSHGNVIRGNLIHDIAGSDARYQNAIYLDDMASGIVVESNLVVRCNWGMLIGGGRDDLIRDNAFVACRKAISYDARGVGWMAANIADPATSTLHQRLAAMPVNDEPWRTRYPTLRTYLTDRFGRPVGGKVIGNALLSTPLGRIDDRECVDESDTITLPALEGAELDARCDELIRDACAGTVTVGRAVVGPVGPERTSAEPAPRE